MTVKTEASKSSSVDELDELDDSKHVTLALALEEARAAREGSLKIYNDMIGEMERFRAAVRQDLKARKRKFDIYDLLIGSGLAMLSGGIAVAFHWAYSLIVVGAFLVAFPIVPMLRGNIKPG
jgi:hypothetical protein